MNLVSFALRRPISLVIAVGAVALAGFLAIDRIAEVIGALEPHENRRELHPQAA